MGTGKKSVYAEPPTMVLKESSDKRLLFVFRSLLIGSIMAVFAMLISIMACYVIFDVKTPLIVRIFVVILAIGFVYGSITTLTMRRSLEISFPAKAIIVLESSLFGTIQRKEPFSRFTRITVGRAYDSSGYAIVLEAADGWTECLAWNEFGALSLASAMELVNMIAPRMGIEIDAPTCFDEKPLAK